MESFVKKYIVLLIKYENLKYEGCRFVVMYQVDTGIIQRTNIQTDVIVVNQCDKDDINEFIFINKKGEQSCQVH